MIASSDSGPAGLALAGLLAAFLLFILLRTEVELLIVALRGLELALPVFRLYDHHDIHGETVGTKAFDEVGAQVLIVLLLALAIDARFFRLSTSRDRLDVAAICSTMLLLAVSELR